MIYYSVVLLYFLLGRCIFAGIWTPFTAIYIGLMIYFTHYKYTNQLPFAEYHTSSSGERVSGAYSDIRQISGI